MYSHLRFAMEMLLLVALFAMYNQMAYALTREGTHQVKGRGSGAHQHRIHYVPGFNGTLKSNHYGGYIQVMLACKKHIIGPTGRTTKHLSRSSMSGLICDSNVPAPPTNDAEVDD
jgi:hypothetical protein